MIAALTLLLLTVEPEGGMQKVPAPPASDMAILYFMAGDLRRAVDTARAGMKSDPVRCKALHPMLVEYQFLVPKRETLTQEEAKNFLAWDKKISPKATGKLTPLVVQRYVDLPLQQARTANQGGDVARSKKLVADVLAVDPANADALALKAALSADAGR